MTEASIQTLSSEVIDQIAAGEVVERPAHLVKELVENSLDAGATQISIEFADGGRYVKVSDNGSGIDEKELEKALDRHATSKISLSDDLWKIKSFGFRGEALASIAAVSKLTLISKTSGQKTAARLVSEFGRRTSVEAIGGSAGTSVVIEKLFENVPARLKFLKSASAEGSRIKMALKALALAHPQVEMKITQDGQLISYWGACETRLQRVQQVLEVENLFEGTAERGSVKATAVFADPKTVQKTAKDLWFFAQNRWIQDRSLQAAVMEAYRHLLMHGEYPIAVVWVETDPSEIDVNIHPTKSQVKFADPSMAFRAVQASIRDVLEKAPWLPSAKNESQASPGWTENPVEQATLNFSQEDLGRTQFSQKSWTLQSPSTSTSTATSAAISRADSKPTSQSEMPSKGGYWSNLQVLAQSNLTYIVTQNKEGIVFVDQHAAHERILFEKLMQAWQGGKIEVQESLFPLAVDLSSEKVEALMKEKEAFAKLGIQLEMLGPETVGVKSAPAILKESALHQILEKTSHELVEQSGSHFLERKIGDLLATMACHSAIRAGQALSAEEMRALLEQMDEFPLSSFCPHGRPVSIDYPFHRLEKDFGRTV
ncbi:MAG: DNA mismatch repair endonuclease MutL [Pseudobdellovibrionaceae bacterium]